MADTTSVRERLQALRKQLDDIAASRENWGRIEAWVAGARPFLRQHFPDHVEDLNELAKEPRWIPRVGAMWVGGGSSDPGPGRRGSSSGTNDRLARDAKGKLLAFVDALLQSMPPEGAARAAPDEAPPPYLPFRPYRRPRSEHASLSGYSMSVQRAAIDGSFEHDEVEGMGGYRAIVESIQRHAPRFDPANAREPCSAPWMNLKPVLVKVGLAVDENTTITDIKAFLDHHDAPAAVASQEKDMPDPKTVFVVHGRNELDEVCLRPEQPGYCWVFGFPAETTRTCATTATMRLTHLMLGAPLSGPAEGLDNFNPAYHFLLDANRDTIVCGDGSPGDLPYRLNGISGCSVWQADWPGRGWSPDRVRIVGVQQSYYRSSSLVKATCWAVVAHILHRVRPELRDVIELHLGPAF